MEFTRKSETLPFSIAIREGRNRMRGLPPLAAERRVYTYVERGYYGDQVRRAIAHFPREQLLFLRSRDLWNEHVGTLARISSFLGISTFPDTGPKRELPQARGPFPSEPSVADRTLIAGLVHEQIREFAVLTGLDVSDWPVTRTARPNTFGRLTKQISRLIRRKGPEVGQTLALPTSVSSRPLRAAGDLDRHLNVLFIVADDLNGWVGAMGRQPNVKTPAIDSLARRGTLFTRAYCAAPYCNASRMAVFTGCLPTTTGVYGNEPFWDAPLRRKTYIEAFKEAGYYTFGAGKVFHGGYDYARAGREQNSAAEWISVENRSHLWDQFHTSEPEPLPSDRPLNRLFDFGRFSDVPPMYHHFDWGPLPDAAEASMPDERVFRSVANFLGSKPPEPFFCAAGIYKPHLPWHVPKRFFDLYDPQLITLPVVRDDDLDDVPEVGRNLALSPPDHQLVTSRGVWRPAVQGYLAAVSFCDWIVGRIVAELDRSGLADNTLIVLWGDNGFHLGEKLHWRKFALWEEATLVPLVFVPPSGTATRPFYDAPVSLIDLFPTIAELCGVSGPTPCDGRSLVQAMTSSDAPNSPALMTWGKGNHSVRDGDWRYTRYHDGSEELYNHRSDPYEWTNLARDVRLGEQIEKLRRWIRAD